MKPHLRILLLCDGDAPGLQNAILDHIAAFGKYSRHWVVPMNPRSIIRGYGFDFSEYDAIIIHFTLWVIWDAYLPSAVRRKIAAFKGLKIQFIQDEYRQVDRMVERIDELGIDIIFTVATGEAGRKIYHDKRLANVEVVSVLTSYVPENLIREPKPRIEARSIDVGYRAREVPFWWGALGREKVEIAERFLKRTEMEKLNTDISWRTNERIDGVAWRKFLTSCKAVLGTEGGVSIIDFDGGIEQRVGEYVSRHPEADFPTVSREILAPYEGNVDYNMISPRVFEAAALKTAMIMFPGEYSGVVEPWRHYLPLKKDFSNLDEILEKLRDDAFLQDMVDGTYEELVASGRYSYQRFMAEVDEIICDRAKSYSPQNPAAPHGNTSAPPRIVWMAYKRCANQVLLKTDIVLAVIAGDNIPNAGAITLFFYRYARRIHEALHSAKIKALWLIGGISRNRHRLNPIYIPFRAIHMFAVCMKHSVTRRIIFNIAVHPGKSKGLLNRNLISDLARILVIKEKGQFPIQGSISYQFVMELDKSNNRLLVSLVDVDHEKISAGSLNESEEVSSLFRADGVDEIAYRREVAGDVKIKFFELDSYVFSTLPRLCEIWPNDLRKLFSGIRII